MSRASLAVLAVALVSALVAGSAFAQDATQGRITGELTFGTADAEIDQANLTLEFIVLAGAEVAGTVPVTVEDDGTFSVDVPLDPERRYLPSVTYEGVLYFGQTPVTVSAEQPEAVATTPTLYATTDSPEGVHITTSSVAITRVDWATGEIIMQRTDALRTSADRTFTGGTSNVTVRIPLPEGTTSAVGESLRGELEQDVGLLVATTPILPDETSTIASTYAISYDVADDGYTLRVTVPFSADRIQVRIPEAWANEIELESEGREAEPTRGTLEDGSEVALRTFVLDDAGPGDSLVLRLSGFAPRTNDNPLAEPPGSIIAGAIALVVIGVASAFAITRGRGAEA